MSLPGAEWLTSAEKADLLAGYKWWSGHGDPEPFEDVLIEIVADRTRRALNKRLADFAEWLSRQEELDVFTPDEAVEMFLRDRVLSPEVSDQ